MTNRIAIILGALILAAILVDAVIFGAGNLLFLSRKLLEFLDWIAFWR